VLYVDAWTLFTSSGGGYSAFLPDASGTQQEVRTTDGVHLTAAGDDRLAHRVLAEVRILIRPTRGASSSGGSTHTHGR
jgi:hypothetical protein